MALFLSAHWLDIVTTVLGLAYILLEYKASVWMWAVGFLMQSLGIVLYYQKGLYADCGMEFYYLAMTIYGWWNWIGKKAPSLGGGDGERPIRHFPRRLVLPWLLLIVAVWGLIYYRWHLGLGTQVSGTVVHLDCRRCSHLRPLFLQGHSLQGFALCPLCRYCHPRLPQVATPNGVTLFYRRLQYRAFVQ